MPIIPSIITEALAGAPICPGQTASRHRLTNSATNRQTQTAKPHIAAAALASASEALKVSRAGSAMIDRYKTDKSG